MIETTYRLIRRFSEKIKNDHIQAYSAQAAFFIIISFFPFIMLLLSIIQYFPVQESTMLKLITHIFPSGVNSWVVSIIKELYATTSSKTLISITALTTLWSAAKGFLAITNGLNSVYDIKETRHYLLLRAASALHTLLFAIMLIITMVLFVFGNRLYLWIEKRIPIMRNTAFIIISFRTIVGLIALIILFLSLYIVVPNRKSGILQELPGAFLCAAGWMCFSYVFSFYFDNFSKYSSTYGSLTAIVLFMLWMYFLMYLLFLGFEFNLFLQSKAYREKLKALYQNCRKSHS
jgi:membrane protein